MRAARWLAGRDRCYRIGPRTAPASSVRFVYPDDPIRITGYLSPFAITASVLDERSASRACRRRCRARAEAASTPEMKRQRVILTRDGVTAFPREAGSARAAD
jgi:hypothetical protein